MSTTTITTSNFAATSQDVADEKTPATGASSTFAFGISWEQTALINIDYTYDFVAADGALTCGEAGQAIEPDLVALTREAYEAGAYVVFAIDCHEQNDPLHPETKLFPPHNIKGTVGRALYGSLDALYKEMAGEKCAVLASAREPVAASAGEPVATGAPRAASTTHQAPYWMDKRRYSSFCGTDLDLRLRERNIKRVVLVGVCTDICVLHTAVDAYNLGYEMVIPKACVASFNPQGHEWALGHFASSLGATVL